METEEKGDQEKDKDNSEAVQKEGDQEKEKNNEGKWN